MITSQNARSSMVGLLSLVQDTLTGLDVWRQNARTPDEVRALRRAFLALGQAEQELREIVPAEPRVPDSAQEALPLQI